MKNFLLCLALLSCSATPAISAAPRAAAAPASTIQVERAYSHPTAAPGVPGVGFLTLRNAGKRADRLLAVESPAAARIEIHESRVVQGVMQMRALPKGVLLPAGQRVSFGPGGTHLMLFALREPLREGMAVPVTLRFERAGRVDAMLQVEPRGPAEDHSHHEH